METVAKGNAAEAAVLNAFVGLGFPVLVPFGDGLPYDLVVHLPGNLFLRVQCKSSRADERGCLVFNSRSTDHGRGEGSYIGLADLFGVYFPPTRSVFAVPVVGVPTSSVRLRLDPTRNNQRRGIRLASDYEIERWTEDAFCDVARQVGALELAV